MHDKDPGTLQLSREQDPGFQGNGLCTAQGTDSGASHSSELRRDLTLTGQLGAMASLAGPSLLDAFKDLCFGSSLD